MGAECPNAAPDCCVDSARRDPGALPNYDLIACIGAGGFGDVWLARERLTDARRVVKILYKDHPERAARDIAGVKRYQQCAHNHANLLQILTVGETDRCFYYVMEAADDAAQDSGDRYQPRTLRQWMIRQGRLDGGRALELMRKLAAGVVRLHEQGLAHHDLKPENVLMVEGEPKIADVGLVAPLVSATTGIGTPAYISPDGVSDDLYALGKMLYELISGYSAAEFPRLPPELVAKASPELAAAIALANRACNPRPDRRFATIQEFEQRVAGALDRRARLRRWRRLSRRAKLAVSAGALVLLAGLAVGAAWVYARWVPVELYRVRSDQPGVSFKLVSAREIDQSGVQPHPFIHAVGSSQFTQAGQYALRLDRPIENFVADFHFRSLRPWGGAALGLAPEPDGRQGVHVVFRGQPDGLGLRTHLDIVDALGEVCRPGEPILGHPQPGVEYLARVVREPQSVKLVLWPLACTSPTPIVRELPREPNAPAIRYVTLAHNTTDPRATAELRWVSVAAYSRPLSDLENDPPALVRQGRVPAYVPPLPAAFDSPAGNLLAEPFHPYDSDAWMPIGSWCWWAGANPEEASKIIRCTPFSTGERSHRRDEDVYDGLQMLRFDQAAYGDFEARVVIKLADPRDPQTLAFDPLVCRSHGGFVGLAFRLQDAAPPGCAWGRACLAIVGLEPDERTTPHAAVESVDGLVLIRSHVASERRSAAGALALRRDVCPRDELFAPEGFALTVRAAGPNIHMLLNDRLILETVEPDEAPAAGRIALVVSRLIVTFDALHVTPLRAE